MTRLQRRLNDSPLAEEYSADLSALSVTAEAPLSRGFSSHRLEERAVLRRFNVVAVSVGNWIRVYKYFCLLSLSLSFLFFQSLGNVSLDLFLCVTCG